MVSRSPLSADVGPGFGDVGELYVDEVFGRCELVGVDECERHGQFVFLGDGERDCVRDLVERHLDCSVEYSIGLNWGGVCYCKIKSGWFVCLRLVSGVESVPRALDGSFVKRLDSMAVDQ